LIIVVKRLIDCHLMSMFDLHVNVVRQEFVFAYDVVQYVDYQVTKNYNLA